MSVVVWLALLSPALAFAAQLVALLIADAIDQRRHH